MNDALLDNLNSMSFPSFKNYIAQQSLKKLHKLKLQLDDIYYNTGQESISDSKYDFLKDFLIKNDPSFKVPVGAKLREGENRVELPYWLGSADKITPDQPDILNKWIINNPSKSYIISEKLDGVSCLLIHNNNNTYLYTRGDGIVGADISYLRKYFHTIPVLSENIAVRGELVINKNTFIQKYKNQTVNNRQYKNPRNMVSGLIGSKTARSGLENIDFVAYEIVGDNMPKISTQLIQLENIGFKVVNYTKSSTISIEVLSEILLEMKSQSEYEIDGIIIQANVPYDRNTSGNPEYMFAYKMLMDDAVKQTIVEKIEWNVSKWGQLKPVVIIKPVVLNDITMSRATAHNAKYVVDNNLGPGAIISITRSMEVIPYIVSVDKPAKKPQMPDMEYDWDKNHVNISVRQENDTICIKLIADFFSKLGIKHVSEATVSKMIDNGLDNVLKIISASKQRLLQVPEFQEKSAERIHTNIRNGLQNVKLSILLGASGVLGYGIGQKRVDALLLGIPNLLQIYKTKTKNEMKKMIMGVEGFSDITANKIVSNLKYGDKFIQKLEPYIKLKKEKRVSEDMKGHKYVMTG